MKIRTAAAQMNGPVSVQSALRQFFYRNLTLTSRGTAAALTTMV